MRRVLKVLHLIALAIFVGSIPAHIVLGSAADPLVDLAAFAALQDGKVQTIRALTLPGLAATVASGLALAWASGALRRRWVRLKIALTALVALNGALVLSPTGQAIAAAARQAVADGTVPATLTALEAREAVFGATNLVLIGAIIALAVARPRLGAALAETEREIS